MYYVYDLINSDNVTVYVGETIDPSRRLRDHLSKQRSKFYKQDLAIAITSEWTTRTEALAAEGMRKLELGMEWTEKTSLAKAAKIAGRIAVESGQLASIRTKESQSKGARAVAAMRVQCPYCNKISNPGAIGKHKKTCKHKPL